MDTKPVDAANTRVPSRWRAALDAVSAFSMIVASIAILWAVVIRPTTANVPVAPAPSEPGTPVSLSGAVVDGDPNAPFAIVEFSDFRCPACTAFARDTLPTIRRLYVETGKALFAFRTLPLERQHPGSRQLAAIARCAGEQGKFWTLHDYLFRAPEPVDAPALQSVVPALGLNTAQLETCRTTAQTLQLVENDILAARTLGLEGTPTFLSPSLGIGRTPRSERSTDHEAMDLVSAPREVAGVRSASAVVLNQVSVFLPAARGLSTGRNQMFPGTATGGRQ